MISINECVGEAYCHRDGYTLLLSEKGTIENDLHGARYVSDRSEICISDEDTFETSFFLRCKMFLCIDTFFCLSQ